MKFRLLVLSGVVLMALAAPLTPAAAQDYYGAIAFSPNNGALGWANDYDSRGDAESEALSQCGRDSCRVVIWFKNACGAIATSSDHSYGSGWSTSRSAAEGIAMRGCLDHASDCSVQRWVCTTR